MHSITSHHQHRPLVHSNKSANNSTPTAISSTGSTPISRKCQTSNARNKVSVLHAGQASTTVNVEEAKVDAIHEDSHDAEASPKCPLRELRPLGSPTMGTFENFLLQTFNPQLAEERTYAGKPIAAGRFLGVMNAVMVGEADAMKDVLSYEPTGRVKVELLVGEEAVFCVPDPVKHRLLRQLMAPALGQEAVDSNLDSIHHIIIDTLDKWVAMSGQGKTVLASSETKNMALKIVTAVALDLEMTDAELEEFNGDFLTLVANLFNPIAVDAWPLPFHAGMQARRRIVARLNKQDVCARGSRVPKPPTCVPNKKIAKTRAALASETSVPAAGSRAARSTLRKLLTAKDEEGRSLTDQQVIDNLILLCFAGHDTSASQLTSLLYELAKKPEVLARVLEEQQRVMAVHGPFMTPAALKDMRYTQAVLQEVLRIRPPVGGVIRSTTSDVAVSDVVVPQGQMVVLQLSRVIAKDPRWPAAGDATTEPFHPTNFNPDRFLTPEGSKQGAQFPFGTGTRTCAGMALAQAEAKIFLATLARGYTFSADSHTTWELVPIPRPKNGLPVFFNKL